MQQETPVPPQRSGISVTEKDVATLNNYAEKKLQERTELSEVMSTVPSIVHRGGIYLMSAAVGFTAILLYFGKITVWVNARGNLVPEVENISIEAEKSGEVTEVFAEVGQKLPEDATLLTIKVDPDSTGVNKITMPRSGTIAKLEVQSQGQLIAKNDPIATIISAENDFIVQATISERDISFIAPGMEAKIKVDAYNFHEYGSISARVNRIFSDIDRPGNFIVILDLIENKKQRDRPEMKLFAGLNVQVEIQTKERRLFEILLGQQQP